MRFGRVFRNGKEEYGYIKNNEWYRLNEIHRDDLGVENVFAKQFSDGELVGSIADEAIRWLPPIARPGKIICVGRNYSEHSIEQGKKIETKPLLFSKYPSNMVGHLSRVNYPNHTSNLDYEVELAVIIGQTAHQLTSDDDPLSYVFGYTVANDLTARDVQKSEKQWTRGKAFDQSLPIGPWIVTAEEVENYKDNDIWLTVNGDNRQLSNTSKMIFDIPYLIRYISQEITLFPGDIILTGTPAGVGYYMEPKATLQKGDKVACGITSIGELRFEIV